MAPNIRVPMNFGTRLLDSPTHSTLELKASQGAVVRASSVILSFNSPVIDHMTTTLHLTSVDMEEFSVEAVRYFVDAAYSGTSPDVTRDMFRDINKLANVFEMSWLVSRCAEHFSEIAGAMEVASYEDCVFLFEEAAYVLTNLKSRQLVEITLSKLGSVNGRQEFISQYLENLPTMSYQQLDLIIELAGSDVSFVVEPLTKQLTDSLSRGENVVPANCKYLLENCTLHSCQIHNVSLFEELFNTLQQLSSHTFGEFKWVYALLKNSSSKALVSALTQNLTDITPSRHFSFTEKNVIPNLFHTLDCSMTLDETVDWLCESEQVKNLGMLFEGLWIWLRAQGDLCRTVGFQCSQQMLQKFSDTKERRNWNVYSDLWLKFEGYYTNSTSFFTPIKADERLCTPGYYDMNKWIYMVGEQKFGSTAYIFTEETDLFFNIMKTHLVAKNCAQSDQSQCGFILKTVPAKGGANMFLCSDPTYYSKFNMHYHEKFQAENMHFVAYEASGSRNYFINQLSWSGVPVVKDGAVLWGDYKAGCSHCGDQNIWYESCRHPWRFALLVQLSDNS